MATKNNGATLERIYDEFEPFCSWKREEGRDILEVHIPEFKKDQLRVQGNSLRDIMITGERLTGPNKWSRFRKEMKIPTHVNANEIKAKLSDEKLLITMPKNISPSPSPSPAQAPAQFQENEMPNKPAEATAVLGFKNSAFSRLRMSRETNMWKLKWKLD